MSPGVTLADTNLARLVDSACRGKAPNLVKRTEKFNGIQAWKMPVDEYRPQVAGKFNAIMMGILKPNWDDTSAM